MKEKNIQNAVWNSDKLYNIAPGLKEARFDL